MRLLRQARHRGYLLKRSCRNERDFQRGQSLSGAVVNRGPASAFLVPAPQKRCEKSAVLPVRSSITIPVEAWKGIDGLF